MRGLLRLFLLVAASLGPGCAEPAPPPQIALPSLFPAGNDVHDLGDAREEAKHVLSILASPRWFEGFPGMPQSLQGVPLTDRGARLAVRVVEQHTQNELHVDVTLRAGARPIWRQSHHRGSNVVPLLLGFFCDGRPLQVTSGGSALCRGISRFHPLVTRHGSRQWRIRLDRKSVVALLPSKLPKRLELVVVFCERQHAGFMVGVTQGRAGPTLPRDLDAPYADAPLLLRSQRVLLR